MPRKYQKPPLSISEQANLLIESRLICDDRMRFKYLVVIQHLMYSISPNSTWKCRLTELLATIDPSNHKRMGFPNDWQSRKIWSLNSHEN